MTTRDAKGDPHTTETFGQALKRLRKAARLTQSELAASAGISEATIGHAETMRRHPEPQNLERLIEVLRLGDHDAKYLRDLWAQGEVANPLDAL